MSLKRHEVNSEVFNNLHCFFFERKVLNKGCFYNVCCGVSLLNKNFLGKLSSFVIYVLIALFGN